MIPFPCGTWLRREHHLKFVLSGRPTMPSKFLEKILSEDHRRGKVPTVGTTVEVVPLTPCLVSCARAWLH